MDKKIIAYVGANNTTHKMDLKKIDHIVNITTKWFKSFSLNQGVGIWNKQKEDSLKIEIFCKESETLKAYGLSLELKQELKQEAIIFEVLPSVVQVV